MSFFESYSLYGEDSMVNGVFKRLSWIMQEDIFTPKTYLDLGCYLPIEDSNTYFLYKLGWSGTLIDANPAIEYLIKNDRPRDVFFNIAASSDKTKVTLNMFNDFDSANTTSLDFLSRLQTSNEKTVVKTVEVEAKTLEDIITLHVDAFKSLPFLVDIDIEGEDFNLLNTYSWKYRPPFILIEDDFLGSFNTSKIKEIMNKNSYAVVSSNFLTSLYVDETTVYFSSIKQIGQKS
jgi:hypothetical protein